MEDEGSEINLYEHARSETPSLGSESSDLNAEEPLALGIIFQAEGTASTAARRLWGDMKGGQCGAVQ